MIQGSSALKTLNKLILFFLLISFCTFSFAKENEVQIKITGVNKEIEQNIRDNLLVLQEYAEEGISNPAQMEQRAQQEILTTLQPHGFYNAQVKSEAHLDNGIWKLTFNITLGEPVIVKAIHFNLIGEGEKDPTLQGLLAIFPPKIGDTFIHEQYEQGKKALLSKTIQSGYLTAIFTEHHVEVYPETRSSEIYLTLATGPRHYFGPVKFSDTVLSEKLLKRYLPFHEGEVYSPEKVVKLQSYLNQSDYFSQVNVKAQSEENSLYVPIYVELEDAKPNQYILGAGYGTDTGMRGKLGWTRRRLNSLGHRFSAQAQVAEIYNKIRVEYIIPGRRPQTDQTIFQAGFFEDEFSEKRSHIYETGIVEERQIHQWQRRLSLNYHHERFNAFITNETVESKLILPSITFIQVKRNESATPNSGRRIEITLRGSIDALFSDTTFLQTYMQLKWLHAFSDSLKLLTRYDLGFTLPTDSEERLPLSQRFFAGGDLSLRGYGYRSLPNEIDKNGIRHPVGGSYLAVGSVELVKTIKKPFGVFTFVDAGNAFRQSGNEIAIGTGVGVEWQTRLGPVKFAIAKPLTKTADSWRIHASFGPEL